MNIIAIVPARSGSKRVVGKNIRPLGGHPLLSYTIAAAKESNIFDGIYCSTDSEEIGEIAEHYGATWISRPPEYAQDISPDIEWIKHILEEIEIAKKFYKTSIYIGPPEADTFMILRPTSPFRTAETIRRAWSEYREGEWMKAIEPVKQHPGKMWFANNSIMESFVGDHYHSLPIQNLFPIYVQNGSIEIRPTSNLEPTMMQPFFTQGYEGYDINTPEDILLAELLIEKGLATLPEVKEEP